MRIAFVYDGIYPYSLGGAEKRVYELSRRLAVRGHNVTILGMKQWDGEDIVVEEGVRLWGVCPPKERFVKGRRSIKQALYFAYKVLPPLFKESFDIVDCQNFPYFPCFSAKLASIRRKSRLIITWLEVWDDYWFEYLGAKGIFGRLIERITAHLSPNIIAISEMTKKGLQSIKVKKNIKVIPVGVDFEEIERVSLSDKKSDVIFAGRLIKDKNVDVLIKAIALINKEDPDTRCTIIGDGPEKKNLERLTIDLNLQKRVQFLGSLENSSDVISHMKSSRVFVLPSTREGFGIIVLEANACGLPVITVEHKRNAASHLVAEGENGFICDLSEEDMAQKMMKALKEKETMEKRCLENSRKYNWEAIVDSIENAYHSARG